MGEFCKLLNFLFNDNNTIKVAGEEDDLLLVDWTEYIVATVGKSIALVYCIGNNREKWYNRVKGGEGLNG